MANLKLPSDAHDNQNDVQPGYYRNQSGIHKLIPDGSNDTQSALTASDLARLEGMSREDHIELIRKLAGASGLLGLALLSPDELKACTRLRLAELAITCKDDRTALQAIGQLLDRLEGKPVGTAQNIMIGTGSGDMNIKVVLVSAADRQREEVKLIEG